MVWATSVLSASEVLVLLFEKYCMESDPEQFALYVVRENGGIYKFYFYKIKFHFIYIHRSRAKEN